MISRGVGYPNWIGIINEDNTQEEYKTLVDQEKYFEYKGQWKKDYQNKEEKEVEMDLHQ